MRNLALLLVLCAGLAQAAPNVIVASVAADAQGDTLRPVVVTVTVENRGNEPSPPGQVVVTFTPKVSGSKRSSSGKTMFDPLPMPQQLPSLKPGEKLQLTVNPPYQSRNSFRGQRGTFRASNVDPTGTDVPVAFSAVVQLAPAGPPSR